MIGTKTLAGERIGTVIEGPWHARGQWVRVRFEDGTEQNLHVDQLRPVAAVEADLDRAMFATPGLIRAQLRDLATELAQGLTDEDADRQFLVERAEYVARNAAAAMTALFPPSR